MKDLCFVNLSESAIITWFDFSSKGNIISRKIADLDSLNAGLEIKNEVLLSKLKCTDAMANEVLQSVNGLSSHVLEFLNEEKLLCQNSFKEYLAFEEECTACLTNYANKQFEQVCIPKTLKNYDLLTVNFIYRKWGIWDKILDWKCVLSYKLDRAILEFS